MTEPELPEALDLCWPVDPGCLGPEWDDTPPGVKARATGLATATLYRLTLGQVGGCAVTVRPCPPASTLCAPPLPSSLWPGGWWMRPVQTATGSWVNCGCASGGCETGCEIVLPGYVGRVDEVRIGAADPLDPGDYKLIYRRSSYRIVWRGTTDCPFPTSQDLSKPLGEPGTFGVTFLPAHEVDSAGAWAAGLLAAEFAKACTGKGKCQLPKNVRSVSRQGVSFEIVTSAFPDGLTGIREVDTWVALYNPNGNKGTVTQLYSPDMDEAVYE